MSARLILVLPERENSDQRALVEACRDHAAAAKLSIKAYRATRRPVYPDRWQPPVQFLRPRDAHQLYKTLHRDPCLVASFSQAFITRDPSAKSVAFRHAITLETFVEHKSVFELMTSRSAVASCFSRYERWRAATSCGGEDDARVLPLHCFDTAGTRLELETEADRQRFNARFGKGKSRRDDAGLHWARAQRSAYHGREELVIAGRVLLAGMHWDVDPESARGRLVNAQEVWRLRRGSGYVNVYPDSHVRRTEASTARLVFRAAPH